MGEWIEINDRLPGEMEDCLMINVVGDIALGWFEDGEFECWDVRFDIFNDVTHWMPKPPPPEIKL